MVAEVVKQDENKFELATSRRDEVVKLRQAGLTYDKIGRRLGVSRQRAWQILKGKPKPPGLDSKVMLTASDVAQLLGLHSNTVRQWGDKGILKSYRIGPRGDRRFRREEVDSFLKRAEVVIRKRGYA